MICYDREFPESARILMLKGAELVLVPNACPMEINRLSQLRARAFENMLAITTCNYPETVPECNGNSSVFDGIIYSKLRSRGYSGADYYHAWEPFNNAIYSIVTNMRYYPNESITTFAFLESYSFLKLLSVVGIV